MGSIQVKELLVSYRGRGEELVLNIPDLQLEKGAIVGLFGPNHVGKTTLLKAIAQLHKGLSLSNESSLQYDGKSYNKKENAPLIVYVPQDYNSSVFPWFSIKENFRIMMKSLSFSEEETEITITSFCKEFGYDNELQLYTRYGFINKHNEVSRISALSGGQRQILTILRAIVLSPDVIVMDEPFSAIDTYNRGTDFRKKVFDFLRKKKTTTLIVAHELEELIALTDKIIFFNYDENGQILKGVEDSDVANDEIESCAEKLKKKYGLN